VGTLRFAHPTTLMAVESAEDLEMRWLNYPGDLHFFLKNASASIPACFNIALSVPSGMSPG
jgi:hypothetical protein